MLKPLEQPTNKEQISQQEIADYLRNVNFALEAPGEEDFYELAIREMGSGNPEKALNILRQDYEDAAEMSEAKPSSLDESPLDMQKKQIEYQKQKAEKLKKYIDFLKR